MKKTLLVLIMLSSIYTFGQSKVDQLFKKYNDVEGFTTVTVSKTMFNLISKIDIQTNDEDLKATKEMMNKLDGVQILTRDKDLNENKVNFYKEILSDFSSDGYSELMRVKEKNQKVLFLIKEKNSRITELVVVVGGNDNTLISIRGDIDLKTISKLSKSMNIKGLEKLKGKKF